MCGWIQPSYLRNQFQIPFQNTPLKNNFLISKKNLAIILTYNLYTWTSSCDAFGTGYLFLCVVGQLDWFCCSFCYYESDGITIGFEPDLQRNHSHVPPTERVRKGWLFWHFIARRGFVFLKEETCICQNAIACWVRVVDISLWMEQSAGMM